MRRVTPVILAAGKSKRMRTSTPKVLLDLGGRPLIFHIISTLLSLKYVDEIIVVLKYKRGLIKDEISKEFGNVRFVVQGEQDGTAKAVESAEEMLVGKENILVLCADTPLIKKTTLEKFISFFFKKDLDCVIMTGLFKEKSDLGKVLRDKTGNIKAVKEKVDVKGSDREEVNSGIYCFRKKLLFEGLKNIKVNKKKREFFLTDIINIFYREGLKMESFAADSADILGVNDQKNLSLARKIMNRGFIDKLMKKGVIFMDPDTTFISFDTKIGTDSVVYPFTFIEKNVIIGRHCTIGPFAHIRSGSVIEDYAKVGNFAEVNRSRIKKKAKMKHFGYVGDTTVGEDVNIGAGVVVANYDGKKKHKTVIHKKAFIGSDTVIVAPSTIGKGAATGAGSVVTKPVAPDTLVVGVPARVFKKKQEKGKHNG